MSMFKKIKRRLYYIWLAIIGQIPIDINIGESDDEIHIN
jgi:hypothetical protein